MLYTVPSDVCIGKYRLPAGISLLCQQPGKDVIARVRKDGDAALVEFTNRFDRMQAKSMADLSIDASRLDAAAKNIDADKLAALESAAQRVRE